MLLIRAVENGLVILNAAPYLYPLAASASIFFAVLAGSVRDTLPAGLGGG